VAVSTKTDKNGRFSTTISGVAKSPGVYLVTVSYGTKSSTRALTVGK
jgi:hypothetical protein